MGILYRFCLLTLTSAILIAGASSAQAQRQGSMGASSTGSLSIVASVAAKANISNIPSVEIGDFSRKTNAVSRQRLVLWSNTRTAYALTALGSGPSNAFRLFSGKLPELGYTVRWHDGEARGTSAGPAAPGRTSPIYYATADASGSLAASLDIEAEDPQLLRRAGYKYAGVLTIIAAPQ